MMVVDFTTNDTGRPSNKTCRVRARGTELP